MSIKSVQISKVKKVKQEFILENLIPFPKHTLGMIASEGGMGKSFLSLQMACEHIATTNENVGCWFSEDEAPFVKDRYEQLVESGLASIINQDKLHLITSEPIQLARVEKGVFIANYEALAEIRCWCVDNSIKLLILDPLLAFYGGDENNNSQARVYMQPFIETCKQDEITIILVHHASKPDAEGKSRTRGAGAFKDATRCCYELHYPQKKQGAKNIPDVEKIEMGIRTIRNVKDNRGVRRLLKAKNWIAFETEAKILPSMRKNNYEEVVFEMPAIRI